MGAWARAISSKQPLRRFGFERRVFVFNDISVLGDDTQLPVQRVVGSEESGAAMTTALVVGPMPFADLGGPWAMAVRAHRSGGGVKSSGLAALAGAGSGSQLVRPVI